MIHTELYQLPHVGEKETYSHECFCLDCVKVHRAIKARIAYEKAILDAWMNKEHDTNV